jgi:hypothetical protein
MSSRWKLQFSWSGVFLIAIAVVLIALAVFFRSFGGASVATSSGPAPFPWAAAKAFFESIGIGLLFVFAAIFGAYFGFAHLLRRSSRSQRRVDGTDET